METLFPRHDYEISSSQPPFSPQRYLASIKGRRSSPAVVYKYAAAGRAANTQHTHNGMKPVPRRIYLCSSSNAHLGRAICTIPDRWVDIISQYIYIHKRPVDPASLNNIMKRTRRLLHNWLQVRCVFRKKGVPRNGSVFLFDT